MNRIINGKRYDTEKAKEIGYYQHSNRNDFYFFAETLYQKRTGEFFLYGEGNAASKYSREVGLNEWGSGERLMPLTLDQAKEWVEEYLDGTAYEMIFGCVEESDEKKVVSLSLSMTAVKKLDLLAAEKGIPKSDIIEELIKNA